MNASSRKVLRECLLASSSRNQICDGVGSKEVDASKRRGFRDEVDFSLGAIDTTNVNEKRGRERERIRKVLTFFKYNKYIEKRVLMHGKYMNM